MKAILFILISAMAIGCVPCRHITTTTTDSTRIEVRTRIERVVDTVFFEIPVEAERHTVRDTVSCLETSLATSEARINADGSLFHALTNKRQTLAIPTENEIIHRDSIVYRDRTTHDTIEVARELTKWQKMQLRGFWIALAALLAIIGLRVRKILRVF